VLLYCERFVELLIDLQSQLPTRKYTNALIIDLNVLVAVKLSPLYKDPKNQLLRDLVIQLDHYVHFAVNSYTSAPMLENEMHEAHCRDLAHLQRIAIQHFKDKLTVLALSNYASIDKREELIEALADLTDEELVNLCNQLHLRTSYPEGTKVPVERTFYLEILVETFQRRESFIEQARKLTIYPNEKDLFDPRILSYETLSGSRPLPLPKLNLQYLTIPDFLYRAFLLSRYESLYQVRSDIEDALRRMKPQIQYPSGDTAFTGWSKMSIVVPKVSIMEISLPKVGEDWPSMGRGEVYLDLETLPMHARREWAQVRQDDVVFLLSVRLSDKTTNGDGAEQDYAKELGVRTVRSAEIAQVLDDEGRPLRPGQEGLDGRYLVPRRRTLRLRLDARQWKLDNAFSVAGKIEDVYDSINVVVRRKSEVFHTCETVLTS
jgi:intron-binding protein aquarius